MHLVNGKKLSYQTKREVEMAGIEPASERFVPRISTSVASFQSCSLPVFWQNQQPASHLNPKVLFRIVRGIPHGTLTFLRLLSLRSESGEGRRGF